LEKLKLNDDQIDGIRRMYEAELDQLQDRLVKLKNILQELRRGEVEVMIGGGGGSASGGRRGRPPGKRRGRPAGKRVPGRRGRPPKVQAGDSSAAGWAPKRGRGRPPKAQSASPEAPKRGRGRPPKAAGKKRGRPALAKPVASDNGGGPKRRGPKAKWGDYILKVLGSGGKPLTYEELAAGAMKQYGLPKQKAKATFLAIVNSAFRLRTMFKQVDNYAKKGSRTRYVGLSSWFSSEGKIKPEYSR